MTTVPVGLRLCQALKTQAFQRCVLGVSDAALDFPLPIRIGDATRQRNGAIVREHVAIQRIQSRIVDIRLKHAFAEIIEYDRAAGATQTAERLFVEFGPDRVLDWKVSRRTALRL